jgi:hypothetical protein
MLSIAQTGSSGVDALDVWERSPVSAGVPSSSLDAVLAALSGYWANAGARRPDVPLAPWAAEAAASAG